MLEGLQKMFYQKIENNPMEITNNSDGEFAANNSACVECNTGRQYVPSLQRQVAQLGQRDRAKLDMFSITSSVIRKITKLHFFGPPYGVSGAIQALYMKVLMQRNFVAEFHREHASFTHKAAS